MELSKMESMSLDWASKVGQTAGTWQLDSIVSACPEQVDYAGTGNGKRVWVQLLPRSDTTRSVRKSWDLARQFSHRHLITLYDYGETDVNGTTVDFAVFEYPTDTVSEILAGRLLDVDEARAMLSASASALAYLHATSLRHGCVTPPNMFIVGDEVKLGVSTIAPANGGARESDLQQLGATLVEAMAGAAGPDAVGHLPRPFRAIARGCLEPDRSHWTAQRVLEVLEGRAKAGFDFEPALQAVRRAGETLNGRRRWVAAGAVAVLALAGVLLFRPGKHPPKPAPTPVTVIGEETRPSPAKTRPTPAARLRKPIARGKPEKPGHGSWAVIAATYHDFGSAEGRAKQIARKAPRLRPRVYPLAGHGNVYYVVLGSGLTQREAEVLRRNARQAGAPRDTYVTILKES